MQSHSWVLTPTSSIGMCVLQRAALLLALLCSAWWASAVTAQLPHAAEGASSNLVRPHQPTASVATRRMLYDQPNNYGDSDHAKIRVENGCAYPVEVAIMFFYNTWGAHHSVHSKNSIPVAYCTADG